jgi:predicted ATPase
MSANREVRSLGQITRLRVKNYRGLADVDLTLGPLTVFVGLNGAGKSNLLDALRFVRDVVTDRMEIAVGQRGGMSALRRWSPKGRPVDVSIELHVKGEGWQAEYAFTLGGELRGEFRIKTESCWVDYQGKVHSYRIVDGQWEGMPSPYQGFLNLPTQGVAMPPGEIQQGITGVPLTELFLPRAASLGDMAFSALWNTLRGMGFYTLYPNTFRAPAPQTNPYPLEDNGGNIASTLQMLREEHPRAYNRIRRYLQAAVPDVEDIGVIRVGGYLAVQVFHRRGKQRAAFDLAQEADGTARLLALFIALFQEPPLTLVGIEEPELNIHPSALMVLRGALGLASRQTQVLITTHSPDLLDKFPPESFRVVEMENGIIQVGPMVTYQQKVIRDRLFTPGELFRIEDLRREET